jgi:hypothetical protein
MAWPALFALLAQPTTGAQSYPVWVSQQYGRCLYTVTDTSESAEQLVGHLRSPGYDVRLPVELLTETDTPTRCITAGRRAVKRAGFAAIKVRPGTDKDRLPGIP